VREHRDSESGAALVIVVASLLALLTMAALVLDIAQVRNDRVSNRARTDSAASAAILTLDVSDARAACRSAADYLLLNADLSGSFSGLDCNAMPVSCDAATPATTVTGTNDRFTVTMQHPVPDSSSLMDPSTPGNPTQVVHADDGDACERFGVQLQADHDTFFAGVFGLTNQSSTVHSVAKPGRNQGIRTVNLLILERHECSAVNISSSGGGGVFLGEVTDPASGRTIPGYMAVESDGTVGCGSNGTLDLSGSGAQLVADGPPGCPGEIVAGSGEGCGLIELFAPGPPGCNLPACSSAGVLAPSPEPMAERITRAPVDHRYNCKPSYPAAFDIAGCTQPPNPSMDALRAAYGGPGMPAGFQSWTASGRPCNVGGIEIVPPGNWYVDCDFSVNGTAVFTGGDVVFAGNVSTASSGLLAINALHPGLFPAATPAVVFFQSGDLSKSGQSSIHFLNSLVYFSSTSENNFTGGTGAIRWTAPLTGPFEDLALWSDSPASHKFSGSATLELEGLYFVPHGEVDYRGNGYQNQVAAQFISNTLSIGGNGRLVLSPDLDRSVLLPAAGVTLIR
jgi:hypothetical protein